MKTVSGSFLISLLLLFAVFVAGGCDSSSPEEEPDEEVEEKETEEEGETIADGSDLSAACVELSELCDLCS